VANGMDNSVSVLLGNGDGTFQKPITYTVGPYSYSITVGAFKDEIKLDLAVTIGGDNNVSILLNTCS
jgi:hypothetical protein